MAGTSDQRGRRAPTPAALSALGSIPDGFRILPDPLRGQPLMRLVAQPAQVRLLLDRSRESAQAGEPSQDYLAVRHDPRRLSFAVTDGVGSSFLGDVAAQILAAHLSDWLGLAAVAPAGDAFDAALATFLHGLSRQVMDQVATWPLPDSVPDIVRAALDQQRGYGSEAMFACGYIELASRRPSVTVAWLGDPHVRVFLRDGRRYEHTGHTADRWSSRLGPRGEVRSRTWPVAQVARVIVCTDGLLPALDATVDLADAQLRDRLEALARRPGNDDMALIDIGLTPSAMPGTEAGAGPTLWRRLTEEPPGRHARTTMAGSALRRFMRAVGPVPQPEPAPAAAPPLEPARAEGAAGHRAVADIQAPATVRWRRSERGHEVTWSPVPGAQSYAVQVCREPSFAEPLLYGVRGPAFTVPPMPGPIFVRVRCLVDGDPGPWGAVHRSPDGGGDPPTPTAAP